MIAKWIFELLRRERDWRGTLPKIAERLTELPEDRVRAALDLGAALEHVEPDRREAIRAYQLAGPGRDRGRSRQLAIEVGWWQAVGRLAQLELQDTPAHEPLIAACRALIDDGKLDVARKLFAQQAKRGLAANHADFAGLRAELEGKPDVWKSVVERAKDQRGPATADLLVSAARLARADKQRDWKKHLEAALAVFPQHPIATAMLTDEATAREDDALAFELMRLRLLGLDGLEYVDGLRAIATRLMLADPAYHTGMGRRLVKVALERAYQAELQEIPGHLALWALLDRGAKEDGQRAELLPLILRALGQSLPDADRTYLAILGAEICIEAGDREAARPYAAIIAEHAPSHPIVRDLLEDIEELDDADISEELESLAIDGEAPSVDSLLPDDGDFGLDLGRIANATTEHDGWSRPDPRFIDVRVKALDDEPEPRRAVPSTSRPRASSPAAAAPAAVVPAAAAPDPSPPIVHAPTPPEPAPATMPQPAETFANLAVDDEWEVDEQLFRRRRPTTVRPPQGEPPSSSTPEAPAPSPPASSSPARPGPASPKPIPSLPALSRSVSPPPAVVIPVATKPAAAATTTKPAAGAAMSIIPSAAARVLKQAGPPRALPKLPSPPNARPRAERLPIAVDVRIANASEVIHAHTRDLSTTGFFAVTNAPLEVGTEVTCDISMPAAGELAGSTFSTRARIARRDEGGYGFALIEPPPALVEAIAAYK